jgi:hypothetical protein
MQTIKFSGRADDSPARGGHPSSAASDLHHSGARRLGSQAQSYPTCGRSSLL